MILMIDNYDSFTFNITQHLSELGFAVRTVKNDTPNRHEIDSYNPSHLVISPGPGTPDESGESIPMIQKYAGQIPILGVCLGHQCIGQLFGGAITQSQRIMHGKTSDIFHKGSGIFKGLNTPFKAMRYHSLVLDKNSIPNNIEITAWTQNIDGSLDEIMGIQHKNMAIYGVQFHPESILSEHGHLLLKNFLNQRGNNGH